MKKEQNKKKDEDVWQYFFEKNSWIFGYGLNYIFNTPLKGKKLEQIVSGFNFNSSGKRVDALMKTRGLICSLCFGEIKKHITPLLKEVESPYRSESWAISHELAGGLAQLQKSIQKSIKEISTHIMIKDKCGNPTGEQLFVYQPKSFLIIGSLSQFETSNGINEEKYSSFELFRKSITNTEIITFDEVFERAKFIVSRAE